HGTMRAKSADRGRARAREQAESALQVAIAELPSRNAQRERGKIILIRAIRSSYSKDDFFGYILKRLTPGQPPPSINADVAPTSLSRGASSTWSFRSGRGGMRRQP